MFPRPSATSSTIAPTRGTGKAAVRVGVAPRAADDLADKRDVTGVSGERARADVGDAVSGEGRVDDEDGKRGRHREGDHEPRRTGSHAGIVARSSRASGSADGG